MYLYEVLAMLACCLFWHNIANFPQICCELTIYDTILRIDTSFDSDRYDTCHCLSKKMEEATLMRSVPTLQPGLDKVASEVDTDQLHFEAMKKFKFSLDNLRFPQTQCLSNA